MPVISEVRSYIGWGLYVLQNGTEWNGNGLNHGTFSQIEDCRLPLLLVSLHKFFKAATELLQRVVFA